MKPIEPVEIAPNGSLLPEWIHSEAELDEILTRPRPALIEFIRTLSSPLLILGAGGKMGPTLAVLARRAAEAAGHPLEVVAVSRFRDPSARDWLETNGVRTLSGDLLQPQFIEQLPETENLVYMVGLKFGTTQNPAVTWASNALAADRVARRYPRAGMVALSTGNVYPLSPIGGGGSLETAALTPLGEYANSAVARERFLEFHSLEAGTPMAVLRLFYAVDLRYGVLVDLARAILQGQPVDLGTGAFNCIWQGDANELVLRALGLVASPPSAWNLCQPAVYRVRDIANRLGELLGCRPALAGEEPATALLGNSARLCAALGAPALPMDTLLRWTCGWVRNSGRYLGKPTHFEVRNGQY